MLTILVNTAIYIYIYMNRTAVHVMIEVTRSEIDMKIEPQHTVQFKAS